ncbi:MAG TPA: pentapeptide repeat-containing protein, partial [Nitrososphaera sp.]|nr:pentapeptide repeat-containing protein [Nitrososphaera sp.]
IREPTAFQCGVVRFLMSLTAAIFAFFFVGGVILNGKLRDLAISAAGGFVLFILMQFVFDPLGPMCSSSKREEKPQISQAMEQLRKPDMSSRVAGIYALERIAKDSKSDHWRIVEILTSYIRSNYPWNVRNSSASHATAEDVQAIVKVISERTWAYEDGPNQIIDLSKSDLQGQADFTRAHLVRAVFSESNLKGALFIKADLSAAYLTDAVLETAKFYEATLVGTNLSKSNLRGASFRNANLKQAILTNADLYGDNFYNADLTGTILTGADLTNADLREAKGLTPDQIKAAKNYDKAVLSSTLQEQIKGGG